MKGSLFFLYCHIMLMRSISDVFTDIELAKSYNKMAESAKTLASQQVSQERAVYIQTHHVGFDHPLISGLSNQGFHAFP